jgi:hypothetical protein
MVFLQADEAEKIVVSELFCTIVFIPIQIQRPFEHFQLAFTKFLQNLA